MGRDMETVFRPGACTFGVRRKQDGKDLQVSMQWSVCHDSEGHEDDFSVSTKDGDNLVGFACYHDSTFLNWTSSFAAYTFTLLDERGLKKQLVVKNKDTDMEEPAEGQVTTMMGSEEEANRFLAVLERKMIGVLEKPAIWKAGKHDSDKSPKEVWLDFRRFWQKYT